MEFYIIGGYILCYILNIYFLLKAHLRIFNKITFGYLFFIILISLFGPLTFIFYLLSLINMDKIICEKKS